MKHLLPVVVAFLVVTDVFTLAALQKQAARPVPPDLTARVTALETELAQAQADVGELKQQVALLARRGQPAD